MLFYEKFKRAFKGYRFKRAWAARNDNSFADYYNDRSENRIVDCEIIKQLNPKSVYEYGCYSGPNLKYLKDCDSMMLYGSDINSKAIDYAQSMIKNGSFYHQKNLRQLELWLPSNIDVCLVASAFYTMGINDVNAVLDVIFKKVNMLLLG